MAPLPQIPQSFSPVQSDPMFRWNGVEGGSFGDSGTPGMNSFAAMLPTATPYGQTIPASSNALARRQNSRALVPTAPRTPFDRGSDGWSGYGEDPAYLQQTNPGSDEHDNVERLEEMAQRAKREAQAKRKQIPPFVQKLSSFLDESRNTDLIRWSDKGDSFVVLDEDEFAKTLIPELFKHNNYASFVRQLNMYGFHKRVGLSDNSMKASERKNKSPSEYYNPYFRRGHPNLLWLINKPKSGNSKKKGKKDEVDVESEEEGVEEAYSAPNLAAPQAARASVSHELSPLQRKDLVQVKSQIERIQQQQVAISNMLNKMRQDQSQLYQQALLFQNMHERHENSINAILNFLANVFRKSLEEQGGAQTVQDLLASIIPNGQGHPQTQISPTSGVVDLGGFVNQRSQNVSTAGTPKRQPRLLPPIPHPQATKASTLPSTSAPPPAPQASHQAPQMGTVTELFDTSPADTTSPSYIKNELRSNPQEGMMKIIQDTNAVNNTSGFDLPDVAAKTPASMSDDQRAQMLNIMAGSNPIATTATTAVNGIPAVSPTASVPPPTTSPVAPDVLPLPSSLSSLQMPSLHEIQSTQAELDALQRLQTEQADQIDALTHLLGPLSPAGRIPGLDENGNPNTSYFDSVVDYDQFLHNSAFSDPTFEAGGLDGMGMSGAADGTDFNFSLDDNSVGDYLSGNGGGGVGGVVGGGRAGGGAGQAGDGGNAGFQPGRVFEATSLNNTPSPAGTEEITRADLDSPDRGAKRRRKD
jgi:heat shock transcription factor